MKKETMEKLKALPLDSQEKVWKLAMERLKAEKAQKIGLAPPRTKEIGK